MSTTTTAIFLTRTAPEPPAGSVVLTNGVTGTAWQSFFSDELWHSVSGRTATWVQLQEMTDRKGALSLVLVHEADLDDTAAPVSTAEQAPTYAQLLEIERLAHRIEREVTVPASRADAASLLLTLRARVRELVADGTLQTEPLPAVLTPRLAGL